MNYQTSKIERFEMLKVADYTNSNDFVNAVNDFSKKYTDLIHKPKELSSGKRTNAITLLRRADRVNCLRK